MSERSWGRMVAAKLAVGFVFATVVAPALAVVADRARVYRNTIRLGRRTR